MTTWEHLDIDWDDFHPNARKILDDPFYWDCVHDFAPHGNDTGADLLAEYQEWLQENPAGDPVQFYEQLIEAWGFSKEPSSDIERLLFDDAAVALAFAEIKLRDECRPAVAAAARSAMKRQRQRAIDATDWPHREQRLQSLDMLETKLPTGS